MAKSVLHVFLALLLAGFCTAPPVEASPTSPVVVEGDAVDEVGVADAAVTEETSGAQTSDTGDTSDTDTINTDTSDADTTDTTDTTNTGTQDLAAAQDQDEVYQQHAVPPPMHPMPVPKRRSGDKRLRQDRGMLAAGIIFAAVCSAGAGLGVWAIVQQPNRPAGQDSADGIAAVTGLLSCTVGALSLASAGALRLKRRRGR